jgi:hypothetical protein
MMIDGAKEFGIDLTAMTRVVQLMAKIGFTDIVQVSSQWPFHECNGRSKHLAEMVRSNFEEGVQGLSLGILAESMLPEEVELHLASLRNEARDESLQIYWHV